MVVVENEQTCWGLLGRVSSLYRYTFGGHKQGVPTSFAFHSLASCTVYPRNLHTRYTLRRVSPLLSQIALCACCQAQSCRTGSSPQLAAVWFEI